MIQKTSYTEKEALELPQSRLDEMKKEGGWLVCATPYFKEIALIRSDHPDYNLVINRILK